MRRIGDFTPLHPLVVALQDPWFGGRWSFGMLAVLVAIGAASWAVAAWRLKD